MVLVVVVLLIAGGLLTWGQTFVKSTSATSSPQQQVYFPPRAALAHAKAATEITLGMIPYLEKYSGQQLVTGAQAHA